MEVEKERKKEKTHASTSGEEKKSTHRKSPSVKFHFQMSTSVIVKN